MKDKLDDKYLVLKRSDIEKYIDNASKRKLNMIVDKIASERGKHGKVQLKNYAVVSETMDIFDGVTKSILNAINGVTAANQIPYVPPICTS